MPNPPLDVLDDLSVRFLEPAPIQGLGGHPKLDEEAVRVIGRLRLGALLSPQTHKGSFVAAHDDPGIRAADEGSAVGVIGVYDGHRATGVPQREALAHSVHGAALDCRRYARSKERLS